MKIYHKKWKHFLKNWINEDTTKFHAYKFNIVNKNIKNTSIFETVCIKKLRIISVSNINNEI